MSNTSSTSSRRRRRDRTGDVLPSGATAETASTIRSGTASAAGIVPAPRHDEIAQRAYELYERRAHAHGHDWDDWFQAERQLQTEMLRDSSYDHA